MDLSLTLTIRLPAPDPRDSAAWLRLYQGTHSLQDGLRHVRADLMLRRDALDTAATCLQGLAQAVVFLALMREVFPDVWAEVVACDQQQSAPQMSPPMPPPTLTGITAAERRFFELIDQRLFPYYDFADDGERPGAIFPAPQGVDYEHLDDAPEAYAPGLLLLSRWVRGEASAATEQRLRAHYALPDPDLGGDGDLFNVPSRIDADLLRAGCAVMAQRCGGLWLALPAACAVMAHDSDNVFLDLWCDDAPVELDWTLESLTWLAAQWREAQARLGDLDAVAEWLAAPATGQAVARLLRTCAAGSRVAGAAAGEGEGGRP